ncbi:hypothetical protein JAAARDRAFT_71361 [Jaapia argillacea MUCL 33604]|uniref:Uncharacterized protein n=1 Tax=Jaapia argillacea MUCL 33604 TaxID=933084 RepID=A0A067PNW8_9AGAM|nr:hypothetical protein JAAARDRAFT_71361 [Jaapia argillacea MUCL 33604]
MTPTLPVELYTHIFSFISLQEDLRQICMACRIFYDETIPMLYHSVDLTEVEQILLFARTVTTNQGVGLLVNELTITVSQPSSRRPCGQILSTLDNLRMLKMNGRDFDDDDSELVFHHGIPRLDVFYDLSFRLDFVHSFLDRHPTVRHWTHRSAFYIEQTRLRLPTQFLPNLTSFEADVEMLMAFQGSRPMEKLCLHYFQGDENLDNSILANLRLFSQTLVALTLDREYCSGDIGCPVVMQFIAENVPTLRRLSILDAPTPWVLGQPSDVPEALNPLLRSLSLFQRLETFEYSPACWDTESSWWRICARGPSLVAGELFRSNPSLRVVTFPDSPPANEISYDINATSYSRGPQGVIEETPATLRFGSECWWD